ncbi:MAG: hypothetical protein HKN46_10955, partial [Acidimicrobiia bacterium]|nr:hypothetical protein [Acidimicrobiia bacterium]
MARLTLMTALLVVLPLLVVSTAPRARGAVETSASGIPMVRVPGIVSSGGPGRALAINDANWVVGMGQLEAPSVTDLPSPTGGVMRPFVWTGVGEAVSALPNYLQGEPFSGWATDVNTVGEVVGLHYLPTYPPGSQVPFGWTEAAGHREVGVVGLPGTNGSVGIGDKGTIVGSYQLDASTCDPPSGVGPVTCSFLGDIDATDYTIIDGFGGLDVESQFAVGGGSFWTSADGVLPLGGSYDFANAFGMNGVGGVAGFVTVGAATHPAYWSDPAAAPILIAPPGGAFGLARDVNDQGVVVGEWYTPSGATHGFMWSEADGFLDLDPLQAATSPFSSGPDSAAFSVNSSGVVAGLSFDETGREVPVLWDPNGALSVDLPPTIGPIEANGEVGVELTITPNVADPEGDPVTVTWTRADVTSEEAGF